jgi:nucleoside-diphosphate-sugar epimerase
VWGPAAEYERTNVNGTRHALAAAQAARMPRFVFTSTPSVVFDGRDHRRATGDMPYAKRFLCAYPRTKAIAEREVLYANARFGLTTCALRPHLIFGPRDPHLLPRLIARARAGRLAIVGDGANEVTLAYVENAALAHVLAAERLAPEAAHAGRAYFIGEPEPVQLWPWIGDVLARLGIAAPARRVPLRRAYAAGAACELAWRILRRPAIRR